MKFHYLYSFFLWLFFYLLNMESKHKKLLLYTVTSWAKKGFYVGENEDEQKTMFTDENEVVKSKRHHLELGVAGEDRVVGHQPRLLNAPPTAHHTVVAQEHHLKCFTV